MFYIFILGKGLFLLSIWFFKNRIIQLKRTIDLKEPEEKFTAFAVPLGLLTLSLVLLFIAGSYYWSQHFFNSLR